MERVDETHADLQAKQEPINSFSVSVQCRLECCVVGEEYVEAMPHGLPSTPGKELQYENICPK